MGCVKPGRTTDLGAGHCVLTPDLVDEPQGGRFYFTQCIWLYFRKKVALEYGSRLEI